LAPPTPTAASVTAQKTVGGVKLPTYIPFQGPKPDLPGTPQGVPPAFTSFPRDLVRSVALPPGKGGDISIMTYSSGAPPNALDQNTAWQEVNKQVGANLQFPIISLADYNGKLNTIVASGELPDMFAIATIMATGSGLPSLPQFLDAKCANLTSFLSGDAVSQFPNLANLATVAWPNATLGGKIWGVPTPRGGVLGVALMENARLLDAVGNPPLTNADEFMAAAKSLTRGGTQWAIAASPLTWCLEVFGAPNNWSTANGTLTKDLETDAYKAAVAYTRALWDAGVMHPDSPTLTTTQGTGHVYAGDTAFYVISGFIAWVGAWNAAMAADPGGFKLRTVTPFPHDGKGTAQQFLGNGASSVVYLKQAPEDRIRELLGVLNYLSAPFGSQEYLLMQYGVEGVDFSFDANGTPVRTQKGTQDLTVPWANVNSGPDIIYNANDSNNYATITHQLESDAVAIGIPNPTVGLYSPTDAKMGFTLTRTFMDGVNQIIYGRADVSTFDQLVADWRKNGGDQIRGEYEEALTK
jgi:putative aldouronate transport system substrate-binding protein